MLFVRRYEILGIPAQLNYAIPVHGEILLRTATGNAGVVYLAESYDTALSSSLRYTLPAGIKEKIKVSNLNLIWFAGSATGDFIDLLAEIRDATTEAK